MSKFTDFLRRIFASANTTEIVTADADEVIEIVDDEIVVPLQVVLPETDITKPKRVIELKTPKAEKTTEQIVTELKEVKEKKVTKVPTKRVPVKKEGSAPTTTAKTKTEVRKKK